MNKLLYKRSMKSIGIWHWTYADGWENKLGYTLQAHGFRWLPSDQWRLSSDEKHYFYLHELLFGLSGELPTIFSTPCDYMWLICGGSHHSFYPYICYCLGSEITFAALGSLKNTIVCFQHWSIIQSITRDQNYQRALQEIKIFQESHYQNFPRAL